MGDELEALQYQNLPKQEKCQHKLVKLKDSNKNKIPVCLDCSSTVSLDAGYAQTGLVKNGLYRRNDGIQNEVFFSGIDRVIEQMIRNYKYNGTMDDL